MPKPSIIAISCFLTGCTVGVSDDHAFGTAPVMEDESTGAGESTGKDEPQTTADDPGAETTADPGLDDDGGEESGSSTGADEPDPDTGEDTGNATGGQPQMGPWSHCVTGADCEDGMGCLNNGADDGVCTMQCVAVNDASGCPESPGGNAVVSCITVAATPVCSLDCSGGKTCPLEMQCTADTSDDGPIQICM